MPFEIISQNDKNLSHPTIAIIDDEFTSRIILDKIVRGLQKDIFVQAFASPLGAIDWLRLNQPDLILVDYLMDEMSGLEVIKTIRRIPHLEHVPIIMITVSNDNEIRHRALDLGRCRISLQALQSLRMPDPLPQSAHLAPAPQRSVAPFRKAGRSRCRGYAADTGT